MVHAGNMIQPCNIINRHSRDSDHGGDDNSSYRGDRDRGTSRDDDDYDDGGDDGDNAANCDGDDDHCGHCAGSPRMSAMGRVSRASPVQNGDAQLFER
jgi:hypothetical protein